MAFNYDKHKNSGDGSVWTSYSDLFLGLSIIFLLLYVTVSLRQGTDGIQQFYQNQKLTQQVDDLKQQIKVYESLKQSYLEKEAAPDEVEGYKELMDKLTLLQEQAKNEKIELQKEAMENGKKEKALNKYQQMIRNIINTNMVAKGRIKTRDEAIETQDTQLASNQEEIKSLEQTVAEKKAQLTVGERKIQNMNDALAAKMKQLSQAYRGQKITKQKFEKQKAELEANNQRQVEALRSQNQAVAKQLNQINSQLNQTAEQLQATQANLAKAGQENSNLQKTLESTKAGYSNQIGQLKGTYEAQRARDKAAYDAALKREQLTGAEKLAKEAQFKAEADRKARELAGKVAELGAKMKGAEAELAKANENLNARRKIAEQIKGNFAANGIKADVDPRTGDVMLSFDGQYFDTDRSELKPEMRNTLEKAIPVYSSSLFQNSKIAEKISNVEIVGFASPTYQGKFVDPTSLDPSDRQAVNYNLDLSYARARSIFNYVFDQNKMAFKYQKELLPLVKVTGRSFLSQADQKRGVANETSRSFCEKNDCAKLQRVIIKFNLKD